MGHETKVKFGYPEFQQLVNANDYLEEIRELLRAQTQMNLLSDLLFHDMISEEVYKSELENIATTEMHMSIKFLK